VRAVGPAIFLSKVEGREFVDIATKRQLKQPDQFVTLTEHGIDWAGKNRQKAAIAAAVLLLVILGVVGGYSWYEHRMTVATTALGGAMETYQAPLTNAAQPLPPGTKSYANEKERAAAANAQFESVAHQFGMLRPGKIALYFAGLTYMTEGQNGSAEDTLKKVSGSWDRDLAALGKLALAQLYQQTGRDGQAADLYNELAKSTSTTVPAGTAQLQLAEMYSSEGKADKAKEIYAKLKDSDKTAKGDPGPAATVAAGKLNPKAAGPGEQ
jgi:tetratricopeptide (TPR) repeat protein